MCAPYRAETGARMDFAMAGGEVPTDDGFMVPFTD
jgi:hypothetical protein